jgi:signal peptidase I
MDVGENNELALTPPRERDDAHEHHRLRTLVRATIVLLVVLGLLRVFVLEPYAIPTGSMKPTIIEGDVLLVNKLPYRIRTLRTIPFTDIRIPELTLRGFGSVERGDVVVFDYPEQAEDQRGAGEEFVKRVAAIAGDTVSLVNGRICVNGSEVTPNGPGNHWGERCVAIDPVRAFELLRHGGRVIVPFEGYRIALDSVSAARWHHVIESEGATVEFRNRIVFIGGSPATTYTFKRDYFFALGDNSADSHDSRFFGFVPVDNLIGRAMFVYWSRNDRDGVRWDRIGTTVE